MLFQHRTFVKWDEAAQVLGMDREGLRQALLYHWSPHRSGDEKKEWLPVLLTLPHHEYMTTLQFDSWNRQPDIRWNNRDSYYQNCSAGGHLKFSDGTSMPLEGRVDGGSWAASHGHGTGWGHTFTVGGEKLVISPETVANACAEDGYIGGIAIAPYGWCEDGFPHHLCFVIVDCQNTIYKQQPRNLYESAVFLRKDLERIVDQRSVSATAKPMDERERTSLLCIIGGLARSQNLDLSKPHKAAAAIAAMLPDVQLSERTIGEHLKRVEDALDSRRN